LTFEIYLSRVFTAFFSSGLSLYPISIALLGMGMSGVFLYKFLKYFINKPNDKLFNLCILLTTVILVYNFLLLGVSHIMYIKFGTHGDYDAFITYALKWSIFAMFIYGFVSIIPFFLVGLCLGLCFRIYKTDVNKIYLSDLIGASLGCVLIIILLKYTYFSLINVIISIFLCISCIHFYKLKETKSKIHKIYLLSLIFSIGIVFYINVRSDIFELKPEPNFLARDYFRKKKVEEIWRKWNLYSRVGLLRVDNREYIFTLDTFGGHAHVFKFDPTNPFSYSIFDNYFSPPQLSFSFTEPQSILIMFAGAGKDMVEAYSYSKGKADITGVEINPLLVNKAVTLPDFHLREFFSLPNVHMVVREGRDFLNLDKNKYDSIVLSWSGASFAYYAGTIGFTAQYLYTKEAFLQYLRHLKDNGTLIVVNLNKIKVLAMAREAFKELGIDSITNKVIILADHKELEQEPRFDVAWELKEIIFKKSDFTAEELSKINEFASRRKKEILYSPGYCHPDYLIYKQLLETPDLRSFLKKIGKKFGADFSISTDDQPFVYNIFPFRMFFESLFWKTIFNFFWRTSSRKYVLSFILLAVSLFILMSTLSFIIIPTCIKTGRVSFAKNYKYILYFSIIGLGYMVAEIFLMQRLGLFLGHPVYSLAIVLAILLLSTGIGSYFSKVFFNKGWFNFRRISISAVILLLSYYPIISFCNHYLISINITLKIVIVLLIIFPLGFILGMFFPSGLDALQKRNSDLIPYVYAINSSTSVIGSTLSIFLSYYLGFKFLLILAIVLYFSILIVAKGELWEINSNL
ncbi:MAG: hypothetical protein NC820_08065, partial [Candidatus Omnitrophica bacterium]|nr:hypothetical protein [Candidatus Omnitrophota bacterium]